MKIIRNIFNIILISLTALILILTKYYNVNFSDVSFEQLLFHIMVPLEGASSNVFLDFFNFAKPYLIILGVIIIIVIIYQTKLFKHNYSLDIETNIFKKKRAKTWNIKDDRNYIFLFSLIICLISIFNGLNAIDIKSYIVNNMTESKFIEENYVDPESVKLTFPEQKQNLIYIFLESMESTYANMDEKYVNKSNLIPNLTKLANDNINFSNNDTIGGALDIYGTNWTVAGMVAQTAGIPITVSIDGNSLGLYKYFLPGSYSLGEILEKEGYNQLILMGSDSSFAGKNNYFIQHGNYQIYDYFSAIENGKIPSGYAAGWGFEDLKVFEIAKEELLELSESDEPFNLTILTADTHFPYGYLNDNCDNNVTNNEYADAVICSDSEVYEFVSWLKKQSFYKNTTIIISGDHLLMGNYLYTDGEANNRSIYNVFINSKVSTDNNKNRIFTTMDMYPTTLASMGVEIEGERLGLGTNLFSNVKTLAEEYGYEYLHEEIAKKSNFYNNSILTKK